MRFKLECPCGDYKIEGSDREAGNELMKMHMKKCVLSELNEVVDNG